MNHLEVIYAFFATLFFSIIFNLKGKNIFYASICGSLGWFTFLFCKQLRYSMTTSFFIAAVIITIYSEIAAKILKTTVTTTLIPALIPLVPGGGIYYTMYYLVTSEFLASRAKGIETLSLTVALSVGIFLVSTFFQIFYKGLFYFKKNILKKKK